MEFPRTIETVRLVLRRTAVADADAVFAYASDPAVMQFLRRARSTDISESISFLERNESVWETGDTFPWAITVKPDPLLVGMIEARVSDHGVELGYVLARSAWGNGYMAEAAQAVVDSAFGDPDVFRVWAYTHVDNSASRRVMEKIGMSREGVLHRWALHPNSSGEPSDAYMYAVWR
ncbi:MAG: GNAT family N-acetyltransferase [Actinobacteria bacterium]|nr:GNAT family N-acetyltransferase [Actinomycetota bacterium]